METNILVVIGLIFDVLGAWILIKGGMVEKKGQASWRGPQTSKDKKSPESDDVNQGLNKQYRREARHLYWGAISLIIGFILQFFGQFIDFRLSCIF